jgi:type IV pilus assembly protein PilM
MVLAVDWDVQRLRLVHAAVKKGSVHVQDILSVDIPPEVDLASPEAMGGLLRSALEQLKIRTRRVILDVPRDQALLTTLNLPAASPDEMPALVEFQVAKELPFSLAEAVVDFAMPDGGAVDGKVDVLVGTVRRDVVTYYERTCAAAGLTMERLGLRPYANKVAVNELLGRNRPGCTMMVDVGPRLTEIDVICEGKLAFSRAASVAVGPMTPLGGGEVEGEDAGAAPERTPSSIIRFPHAGEGGDPIDRVVDALLVEVTRSFEAFRSQGGGRELSHVVVGGDVGVEARLADALGKRLRTTVELYNPARQFGWPEERGREARAFAAALGLACGHAEPGRLHFDFLHPKKTVTVAARRLRKAPAVAVAIVLFVVAGIGFYATSIAPKKKALAEKRAEVRKLEESVRAFEQYEERVIKPMVQFDSDQVVWINELARLQELLPDNQDAVISSLSMYQSDRRINIPLDCKRSEVALEVRSRMDAFRLPGSERQYYKATVKTLMEKNRAYPHSATIDVQVLGTASGV